MNTTVELLVDAKAELGESPVWDSRESVLWWLDIDGCTLHRYDPATGDDRSWAVGRPAGAVVPRAAGGLVLATPEGFATFDPATGEQALVAAVEQDNSMTRMNDGKCDRRGRFFAGTMGFDFAPGVGAFYRLDAGHVTKLFGDVTISNGLAWTPDDRTLYYIDSGAGSVDAFDFDPSTGDVSGRRVVVKLPADIGLPDGMALDTEGCLWVALFGGGAVHRYRPDGTLDTVLPLPARYVTCCAFGGDDFGDLYITTARVGMTEEEQAAQPHAGGLFRCRPGVRGFAPFAYAD